MKKTERFLVLRLETKNKIKELALIDKRSMKSYIQILIDNEYTKINDQKKQVISFLKNERFFA